MSPSPAPTIASLAQTALDEEIARAEVYCLLAALYYAPPQAQLLAQMRVAPTQAPLAGGFLEQSWQSLIDSARKLTPESVTDEYHALFGGVGKPEVYLYASHYLAGFLNEKPLARLRGTLATLGLTRDETMPETEDHIAYLCEVMRYLIAGDDVALANLTQQQEFFKQHLQPWVQQLCETLQNHPGARFYAALAGFTKAYFSVEQQGFDLLD